MTATVKTSEPRQFQKLDEDRKFHLIKNLYVLTMENTETLHYKSIGITLFYLVGAITNDQQIELNNYPDGKYARKLLHQIYTDEHIIWQFIQNP